MLDVAVWGLAPDGSPCHQSRPARPQHAVGLPRAGADDGGAAGGAPRSPRCSGSTRCTSSPWRGSPSGRTCSAPPAGCWRCRRTRATCAARGAAALGRGRVVRRRAAGEADGGDTAVRALAARLLAVRAAGRAATVREKLPLIVLAACGERGDGRGPTARRRAHGGAAVPSATVANAIVS